MTKREAIQYFGDLGGSNRESQQLIVTMGVKVGVTVTAKDLVEIDESDTQYGIGRSVKQLVAGAALGSKFFGIVLDTLTGVAGAKNQVRVAVPSRWGTFVENANIATAVTSGQPIACVAVNGRGEAATVGTHHVLPIIPLENASGNTCDVMLVG